MMLYGIELKESPQHQWISEFQASECPMRSCRRICNCAPCMIENGAFGCARVHGGVVWLDATEADFDDCHSEICRIRWLELNFVKKYGIGVVVEVAKEDI